MTHPLIGIIEKNKQSLHPVVAFQPDEDRLLKLDFTEANKELTTEVIENVELFSEYIQKQLSNASATYGIGGYAEHRTLYSRSTVFDATDGGEPRRLHLGTDIWGKAGTTVFAPLGGMVHSFQFNDSYGDYGATIILLHQLESVAFYTLYGHLSLKDLAITEGQYINRGEPFGHFGEPHENGHWPPHLHFQIIIDFEFKQGDYPGVCRLSEQRYYLENCPDPDLILRMNQYIMR
jgi:peptidoglycan LD-endopeptidase LytH